MSVQWYFRKGATVYGPLTPKALFLLAESGQLQPTDEVLRDDLDRWFPAEKVKGLKFRDARALSTPPLPSQADAPPPKPSPSRPKPTPPAPQPIARGGLDELFSDDEEEDDLVEVLDAPTPPQVVQRIKDAEQRNVLLMSDGTWKYAPNDVRAEDLVEDRVHQKAPTALIDPKQEYFKLDYSRATMKEHLFEYPILAPILIPVALVNRVFRFSTGGSTDDPPVRKLQLCEISNDQIPEFHRNKLDPIVRNVVDLGFKQAFTYLIEDPLHTTTSVWMTFVHPDGNSFARVQCRQWRGNPVQDRGCYPVFVTEFRDGTFLASTAAPPDLIAPPGCIINRRKKKKPDVLWESHQKYLREKCGDKLVRSNRTAEEVRSATERLHQMHTDFHLQRGVFKPLEAKDFKKLEEASQKVVRARSSGLQNPEVIAELEKIQEKKPSWVNAILLLVISAAFFLGVGAVQWSWRFAVMLIGILFVHELGHFLTMMMFGYKNLKMFFIPFFGAAVSGRHYNVAGWKKVLVSLAGPLPGIYLGLGLGIYGLYHKHELSMEIALLSIVLNAFNLIPVLPLDGGWVMHAILFCRHPLLDTAFRVMAGLGLVLLGTLSGGRIMVGVAVAMFTSLPLTYRIAKVTDRLRRKGGVVISPDAKSVPINVADEIISELRAGSTHNANNKQLAVFTLQVFEGVNATPPNWLASLFFSGLHFGSFFLAAVFAMVLVIGRQADLGDFMLAAASKPETPYECGSVQTWNGPGYDETGAKTESTLVAPFKEAALAGENFGKLKGTLPAATRMTWFGATLLIQFPPTENEAELRVFAELEKSCGNEVFICQPGVSMMVNLTCIMDDVDEAAELEKEMLPIWQIPNRAGLIAPWHKNDRRTPEEKQRHRLARETYRKLTGSSYLEDEGLESEEEEIDLEFKKLLEESELARRTGDKRKSKMLAEQMSEHQQKKEQKRIEEIRNLGPEKVDLEVIAAYEAWQSALKEAQKQRAELFKPGTGIKYDPVKVKELLQPAEAKQQEIFKLMGQLPQDENNPTPPLVIKSGHLTRAGLLMTFNFLQIPNGATGLPAFAEWLCQLGCMDITYGVSQGYDFDQDIAEELEGDVPEEEAINGQEADLPDKNNAENKEESKEEG